MRNLCALGFAATLSAASLIAQAQGGGSGCTDPDCPKHAGGKAVPSTAAPTTAQDLPPGLKKCDVNGNGQITLPEATQCGMTADEFKTLDSNHDGSVTSADSPFCLP